MSGVNSLQNTALFSSYFPAVISHSLRFPVEAFFKVWTAAGVACVPVMAYFIARRLLSQFSAVFASLFVMGWVTFYQGGSYARSNFAMVIYGGLILAMLSSWRSRYRYSVSVALAGALSFAHYGAAIIAVLTIGGMLLFAVVRRYWRSAGYIGMVLLAVLLAGFVWHVEVNHSAWRNVGLMVGDIQQMARVGGNVTSDHSIDNPLVSVSSRDKITQVALGVLHPDGDNSVQVNWWLIGFAWLTVGLMSYGSWVVLRGRYGLFYKWLVFLSYCALAATVVLPQVSRGYGIEKVYYQALMATAPCLAIGGQAVAAKVRCPVWLLLPALLIPYVGLMWKYGVALSILG